MTPLAVPFLFTLLGPAVLALWLRRRSERLHAVDTAAVWVHWLLAGSWLYWISALSVSDLSVLAARLQLGSLALTFLIGSALFAAPPLVATASCIAILTPGGKADRRNDTARLVARSVAREAALLVPFGMVLVGGAMFDRSPQVSTASLPAAWIIYKVLRWSTSHWSSGRVERMSQGSIVAVTEMIARRAGVTLGGVYLIANRSVREANAFATRGNMLAMTRGLVERLTRRELTAVIGHEVAHLRAGHVGLRWASFWGYMLVVGPLASIAVGRCHLPAWIISVPVLPVLYILSTSLWSRKHEFVADAAAVELVDDPEGMIAALARLSRMTRTPVNWGGMQGAILSHPSMRRRVLAIANRHGLAEERALALLDNPDLLARDISAGDLHFEIPPECSDADPVFSSRTRAAYQLWGRWTSNLALAAIVLGLAHLALRAWPGSLHVPLGLVLPVPAAWSYLVFAGWLDRCFFRQLRRRIRRRIGACGGAFVGLTPRAAVSEEGGFYAWDLGFLRLAAEGLEYTGERASFALGPQSVQSIEVGRGPLGWRRAYGVVIRSGRGAFVLTTPDCGLSRRSARRLLRRLQQWRSEPGQAAGYGHVPQMPGDRYARRWRAVRYHVTKAAMLFVGLSLTPFFLTRWTPAETFVPFLTPVAYLFAVCPTFLRTWPRATSPRPDSAARKEAEAPEPAPDGVLR